MRPLICLVLVSMLMGGTSIAQNVTTTHQQLTQLAEDFIYTSARLFPTQATSLGITRYDAELETPSEENRTAYIARLRHWRKRLHAIVPIGESTASLVDRNDARVLGAQLAQSLNALLVYEVDRKDYSTGANTIINCIFQQLQFLPVAGEDGATIATVNQAWTDITSRLL
jgi:hypothetical protein